MASRKDKKDVELDPIEAAVGAGIDAASEGAKVQEVEEKIEKIDAADETQVAAADSNPKLADRSDADIALDDLAELKRSLEPLKSKPVIVMLDDDVAFDDFAVVVG